MELTPHQQDIYRRIVEVIHTAYRIKKGDFINLSGFPACGKTFTLTKLMNTGIEGANCGFTYVNCSLKDASFASEIQKFRQTVIDAARTAQTNRGNRVLEVIILDEVDALMSVHPRSKNLVSSLVTECFSSYIVITVCNDLSVQTIGHLTALIPPSRRPNIFHFETVNVDSLKSIFDNIVKERSLVRIFNDKSRDFICKGVCSKYSSDVRVLERIITQCGRRCSETHEKTVKLVFLNDYMRNIGVRNSKDDIARYLSSTTKNAVPQDTRLSVINTTNNSVTSSSSSAYYPPADKAIRAVLTSDEKDNTIAGKLTAAGFSNICPADDSSSANGGSFTFNVSFTTFGNTQLSSSTVSEGHVQSDDTLCSSNQRTSVSSNLVQQNAPDVSCAKQARPVNGPSDKPDVASNSSGSALALGSSGNQARVTADISNINLTTVHLMILCAFFYESTTKQNCSANVEPKAKCAGPCRIEKSLQDIVRFVNETFGVEGASAILDLNSCDTFVKKLLTLGYLAELKPAGKASKTVSRPPRPIFVRYTFGERFSRTDIRNLLMSHREFAFLNT